MDVLLPVTVILTLLATIFSTTADTCIRSGVCKCRAGSFTVDLYSLAGRSFKFIGSDSNTYSFKPCGIAEEESVEECKSLKNGISICQTTSDSQSHYDLGEFGNEGFSGDPEIGNLYWTFNGTFGDIRFTNILLICDVITDMNFTRELPLRTYSFKLKTPLVCPPTKSGLSTGSILVILFFVFLLIYFVAGILIMKIVRKAEGVEIIPNIVFWKELPLLIRDGFAFTARGCKGETTYEKI